MAELDKDNNILEKFILSLEKFSDLFKENSYKGIYELFLKYNNQSLLPKKEDNILWFFENNNNDNITLEELNSYIPNNENENSKIFSNYKKWVDHNNNINDYDIIKCGHGYLKMFNTQIAARKKNVTVKKFYCSHRLWSFTKESFELNKEEKEKLFS